MGTPPPPRLKSPIYRPLSTMHDFFAIRAACHSTEKPESLNSAGKAAGKSAGKNRMAGGTAGSAGRRRGSETVFREGFLVRICRPLFFVPPPLAFSGA